MGRVAILAMLVAALLVGGAVYYFQEYGYYRAVTPEMMITRADGTVDPLQVTDLTAIDAESSPIRFRACFTPVNLPSDALVYEGADPLTAPRWFTCFDARAIGDALEAGTAKAYLSQADTPWGVDRIMAVMPDGRAFAWPQINACGRVVFDGNAAPAGCPPEPRKN